MSYAFSTTCCTIGEYHTNEWEGQLPVRAIMSNSYGLNSFGFVQARAPRAKPQALVCATGQNRRDPRVLSPINTSTWCMRSWPIHYAALPASFL